jgi:hypothetical protein
MVRSSGCPDAQAPGCWSATQSAEECDGARVPSKKRRRGRKLARWREHWRGVFPWPSILSSRNSKSYLRMALWRSSSSPRGATTPSAGCPIAVTSLNLVSCRRTIASDMPDRAAAAIAQPPKFDIWHSAWPQKPQGGAGQDDASDNETMTPRRFPPPWIVIEGRMVQP